MINFDFLTLKAFLTENIDFLQGMRIQKIQQPTRREFVFGCRNNGEGRKFYINISPNLFHICFMSKENEQKRFIEIPQQPPMFCMLLRKYLEGAKVAKVEQPEGERILELYFETYNEVSEKIYLCLAIELMGKHSNVVLYNYDTNVIIGCAHNIGPEKSREREMAGGLPYVYPSKSIRKDYVVLLDYLMSLNTELSGYSLPPLRGRVREGGINPLIDDYFANLQEAEKIKSIKSKLFSHVNAGLKKANGTLEKIKKQASGVEKADLYRKKGDLIMANLFHNKDFSSSIEVISYETNSPLSIAIDETKTLKENANKFYKLYNKAKITVQKTLEMTEKVERERDYLAQVLYSVESAESMGDLLEIQEEIGNGKREIEKGNRKQETGNRANQPLFTIYNSPFTIYVGKNNKQNDYIVSKLARDEDIWFHVHNCAGSHVLLRVENGVEPTDEIIFECAKLAKQHSSAKLSSKVGVIYTKRKFLKKPPAAPLGYVIYKNEKEIIVD